MLNKNSVHSFNIRKLFRDIPVDVLFVIGISVVLFISLNCADLIVKIEKEQSSKNEYKYTEIYNVILESAMSQEGATSEDVRQAVLHLTDYLSNQSFANIYLENIPIQYNYRIVQNKCSIVFSSSESEKIASRENGVFIGETLFEQVGNGNILVDGIECPIVGISENRMSGGIDNSASFTWLSMDSSLREIFIDKLTESCIDCKLRISSNCEFDENVSLLSDNLHNSYGISLEPFEYSYEGDYQNYWYRFYNEIYSVISIVLSTVMCFSICDLWMQRRKKELSIRKACGFSNGKISFIILKDVLKLTLLSLLPMMFWQLLFKTIFDVASFSKKEILLTLSLFCVEILVFILLIFLHMIKEIKKGNLAELVRK